MPSRIPALRVAADGRTHVTFSRVPAPRCGEGWSRLFPTKLGGCEGGVLTPSGRGPILPHVVLSLWLMGRGLPSRAVDGNLPASRVNNTDFPRCGFTGSSEYLSRGQGFQSRVYRSKTTPATPTQLDHRATSTPAQCRPNLRPVHRVGQGPWAPNTINSGTNPCPQTTSAPTRCRAAPRGR
jgi:hypothetical protein